MPYHHVVEWWGHRSTLFNFQTSHGQEFGQRFRRKIRVYKLTQPGFGEFHAWGLSLKLDVERRATQAAN